MTRVGQVRSLVFRGLGLYLLMPSSVLYGLVVLIWGTTWYAIKFQLGVVAPEISLVYRFSIAAICLFVYARMVGSPMRLSWRDHRYIGLQGATLFCLNYWLTYLSTQYLTSGLVAVIFTSIIFFNLVNARVIFGTPVEPRVLFAAAAGMLGVALLFLPEIRAAAANKRGAARLPARTGRDLYRVARQHGGNAQHRERNAGRYRERLRHGLRRGDTRGDCLASRYAGGIRFIVAVRRVAAVPVACRDFAGVRSVSGLDEKHRRGPRGLHERAVSGHRARSLDGVRRLSLEPAGVHRAWPYCSAGNAMALGQRSKPRHGAITGWNWLPELDSNQRPTD